MLQEPSSNHSLFKSPENEGDPVKFWFTKIINHWQIILFSVICSLFLAYLYNAASVPVYQVGTSLILKNNNNQIDLQGISSIASSIENQNLTNNEIEILKSALLINRSLKKLELNICYYEKKPIKKINIYHNCPFEVFPDSATLLPLDVLFNVTILDKEEFQLKTSSDNPSYPKINRKYKFGEKVLIDKYSFVVSLKSSANEIPNLTEKSYLFRYRSNQELYNTFKRINIVSTSSSTVIKISCNGENPAELTLFLNTLCYEYLQKTIEKKTFISNKTLDFIKGQLDEFADSLNLSGQKLGGFKSSHQIMNMDQHSEQIFSSLENLQKEKVNLIGQLKYFEYLKGYLNDSKNNDRDIITPDIWGIENQALSKLITNLLENTTEKSELSLVTNKENPLTKATEGKIEGLKKSIIENVNSLIELTNISIKNVDLQISELSSKASSLPKTQLELFNYERMFKIYDVLYTYLLTKRSEIQISKAALSPDNEVIDVATPEDAIMVYPRIQINYILALILGIAIPLIIILLINHLSDKVRSIEDIESITLYPILGNVIHDNSTFRIPVVEATKSILAESFRSIRANFQFISKSKEKQIILITSSIMSEGKSFVALNLAASFALSGKKTIMLYFDLRKPLRDIPFDLTNDIGLSSILSGNCSLNDAIKSTPTSNLFVLLPGVLPPNPNELISSSYTPDMIHALHESFDYVIIDTPPLGMFADALLLLQYTDINLFLIRQAYSPKSTIKQIMNTLQQKDIKNVHILVNDIPASQSSYGYGYGYSYNYDYYSADKKNLRSRLWHKIKNMF